MGGDGICDVNAMLVTEGYGPVVTSPVHAAFVGARKHTNNTAELSALAELFRSLLHTDGTTTSRLTRGGPNGQRVRDGVCNGENLAGGERTTSELSSSSVAAFSVEARSDMETRQGAQWS